MPSVSRAKAVSTGWGFTFSWCVLFSRHGQRLNRGCWKNISWDLDGSFPCCWWCKYWAVLKAFASFGIGQRSGFRSPPPAWGLSDSKGPDGFPSESFAIWNGFSNRRMSASFQNFYLRSFDCSAPKPSTSCRKSWYSSPFSLLPLPLAATGHSTGCSAPNCLAFAYSA